MYVQYVFAEDASLPQSSIRVTNPVATVLYTHSISKLLEERAGE